MEDFVNTFVGTEQRLVKALVYTALALGFRAGVRPYSGEPQETPVLREVFIEYPQETLIWTYTEEEEADFLDDLSKRV